VKASTVAVVVVGGLAVAGVAVYVASSGGGIRGPLGTSGGQSIGDIIAKIGGSAVATLGKDLVNWTAKEVDSLFGKPQRAGEDMEGPGAPPPSGGKTLYV